METSHLKVAVITAVATLYLGLPSKPLKTEALSSVRTMSPVAAPLTVDSSTPSGSVLYTAADTVVPIELLNKYIDNNPERTQITSFLSKPSTTTGMISILPHRQDTVQFYGTERCQVISASHGARWFSRYENGILHIDNLSDAYATFTYMCTFRPETP